MPDESHGCRFQKNSTITIWMVTARCQVATTNLQMNPRNHRHVSDEGLVGRNLQVREHADLCRSPREKHFREETAGIKLSEDELALKIVSLLRRFSHERLMIATGEAAATFTMAGQRPENNRISVNFVGNWHWWHIDIESSIYE